MLNHKESTCVIKYPDDQDLLKRVMLPYKDNVHYVKSATLTTDESEYLTGNAHFQISESCYIDDTGHFNSVEFNICYNQLMYYTIAKAVKERVGGVFSGWEMDMFWRRQLPDILIIDFKSCFKRPLDSNRFYGEIKFISSRTIRSTQYIDTVICFTDDGDGFCQGAVRLAIINN